MESATREGEQEKVERRGRGLWRRRGRQRETERETGRETERERVDRKRARVSARVCIMQRERREEGRRGAGGVFSGAASKTPPQTYKPL